jgi:hypothetical protein
MRNPAEPCETIFTGYTVAITMLKLHNDTTHAISTVGCCRDPAAAYWAWDAVSCAAVLLLLLLLRLPAAAAGPVPAAAPAAAEACCQCGAAGCVQAAAEADAHGLGCCSSKLPLLSDLILDTFAVKDDVHQEVVNCGLASLEHRIAVLAMCPTAFAGVAAAANRVELIANRVLGPTNLALGGRAGARRSRAVLIRVVGVCVHVGGPQGLTI